MSYLEKPIQSMAPTNQFRKNYDDINWGKKPRDEPLKMVAEVKELARKDDERWEKRQGE